MNIDTFRIIYHGAVMNDDGTLHWDHFADALQKYDPNVDLFSKRGFFNEMAGADGHLTWAKVENWFNHHKMDIQTFKKFYDGAVLNNDGTLHWDHYVDALKKYHPGADVESKRALFNEVAGYDGKLTWPKVEAWFERHKVEIKTMKPMTIDTFRTIYNGAVMNNDGTLHWDHFADALKKYDPNVNLTAKRRFFEEMAKPDGHLTWAKVENWFNNHRVDIQTFRKIYDRAVLNNDGTLHWDHYADALRKYDPAVNLESKRAFFEEVAAPDGHLTWAKVENWFVNHRLTIKNEPAQNSYQYKTACAGGASKTGGYGGPLCMEPFGSEVQDIANQILKDSETANNLCYNNFTDPCPDLTKAQVAAIKGFDYADKTLKCPFGPIPWPAGTPEPGYVPKTNPLTGRWITVTGGDAAFIAASIKSGMLGSAEAEKIKADVDTKKTGGMYLRITQDGDVCTVDASVAKFARAMRTWKSGHYFYEPLVSGGNLFGVWVLPEEYRKIGFFWEMNSGKVFRIQRNAWMQGGYMFMRQSTEAFGRISHVLYVKVSNDPESGPRPALQSRDYTALAGVYNAPDNLGKHYPCTPIDLDAPVQRDTWMDTNVDIVTAQQQAISTQVGGLEKGQSVVGYGWKSEEFTCSHDAVFEALQFKARNPEKFMDVSDVVITDEPGYVSRKMFIKAKGTTMSERIIVNQAKGELVFQPVNPETGRLEHEERVIAVHDDPCGHLEFYQRDSVDGMRTPWTVPITVVQGTAREVIAQAMKLEESVDPVVGLGTHSDPVEGPSHDDLWKAMVYLARDPYFMMVVPASAVSVQESDFIERTVDSVQRVYINEDLQEIVFRNVGSGVESQMERAVILRGHPVELELCERRVINGFRVHSKISKAKAFSSFDTIIKTANRFAEEPPTVVGLGVTSAPLHGVAYPSLFAAVDKTIAMPWLIQNVKESECSGSDCQGYYSRSMKMPHTGEVVKEQIKIDEEKGEVVFTKLGRDSRPSDKQRVLVFRKDPLRIEFFERSASTGARVEWAAPYKVAQNVFTKLTDIAKEFEAKQHGIVGYGMVSHAYTCTRDKLWKAMSAVLREPSRFGIKVDQVMCQDQAGSLKRSYRIISQNRVKVENVRINEQAQEFIFKTVKDGRESEVEHVWTLATNPLRCEMHGRKASDQMRVRWELPQEQANEIFDAFLTASSQV